MMITCCIGVVVLGYAETACNDVRSMKTNATSRKPLAILVSDEIRTRCLPNKELLFY